MKYLVVVVSILSSAVAFAMPKVGDYSALAVTYNNAPMGTVEEELIDFNSASNQYLQKTTETLSGKANITQKWTSGVTDAVIASILNGCASLGGTTQNLTEPAGTFTTCAMPVNSNGSVGTLWVGAVPFGIVKLDVVNSGAHIVEDLGAFRLGK